MADHKQITAYVVQRLSWEYGDDFYYRHPEDDAPMKTFLRRDKAEAHRRQAQWEYVKESKINPFGYVDMALEERSSLPPLELMQRLHEAGLETEVGGDQARYMFWEQYEKLPDEKKQLVWLALDRVRFFELIELQVDVEA